MLDEKINIDAVKVAQTITKLIVDEDVNLPPEKKVELRSNDVDAKQTLEKLADTGARQMEQVVQGGIAKKQVAEVVNAKLAAKGLQPISSQAPTAKP